MARPRAPDPHAPRRLLTTLLAPAPAPNAPRGPTPEELAEQERRRVEELQARAALVAEQRATRDAQQASNMDSMAAFVSLELCDSESRGG